MKNLLTLDELYTQLLKDKLDIKIEYNKIKSLIILKNENIFMLVDGRLELTIFYKDKQIINDTFYEEDNINDLNLLYNRIKFYLDGKILKKLYIKKEIISIINIIGLAFALPLIILNKHILNIQGILLLVAFTILIYSFYKVHSKRKFNKKMNEIIEFNKVKDSDVLIHDELVNINKDISKKLSRIVKINHKVIFDLLRENADKSKLSNEELDELIDSLGLAKNVYSVEKVKDSKESREILIKKLANRYTLYTRRKGSGGQNLEDKEYSLKEFKELLEEVLISSKFTLEDMSKLFENMNISKEDIYRLSSKVNKQIKFIELIGNKLTSEKNDRIDNVESDVSLITPESKGKTFFYIFDKAELENSQHAYELINGKEVYILENDEEYIIIEF